MRDEIISFGVDAAAVSTALLVCHFVIALKGSSKLSLIYHLIAAQMEEKQLKKCSNLKQNRSEKCFCVFFIIISDYFEVPIKIITF